MEVFKDVTAKLSREAKRLLGSELEDILEAIENKMHVQIGFSKGCYSFSGTFTQVAEARQCVEERLNSFGFLTEGYSSPDRKQERNVPTSLPPNLREGPTTTRQELPAYDITFASGSHSAGSQSTYSSLSDHDGGATGGKHGEKVFSGQMIPGQSQQEKHTGEQVVEGKDFDSNCEHASFLGTPPERDTDHEFVFQEGDVNVYGAQPTVELELGQNDLSNAKRTNLEADMSCIGQKLLEETGGPTELYGVEAKELNASHMYEVPSSSGLPGNTEKYDVDEMPEKEDSLYGIEPSEKYTDVPAEDVNPENFPGPDQSNIVSSNLENEECFVDTDLLEYLMKVKSYELKDIERQFFVVLDCRPTELCVIIQPLKQTKQNHLELARDSFINLHLRVHQHAVIEGMKVPSKVEPDTVTSAVSQVQGMYANVLTKLDGRRRSVIFIGDRHLAIQAKKEFVLLLGLYTPSSASGRGRALSHDLQGRGVRTPRFHKATSQSLPYGTRGIGLHGTQGEEREPGTASQTYSLSDKAKQLFSSPVPERNVSEESKSDLVDDDWEPGTVSPSEEAKHTKEHEIEQMSSSASMEIKQQSTGDPDGIPHSHDVSNLFQENIPETSVDATLDEKQNAERIIKKGSGPPVEGITFGGQGFSSRSRTGNLITGSGIYINVDHDENMYGHYLPKETDDRLAETQSKKVYDSLDSDSDEEPAHETKLTQKLTSKDGDNVDFTALIPAKTDKTPIKSEAVKTFNDIEEASAFAKGDSPQPDGMMSHMFDSKYSLPGHSKDGTIIINYDFLSGKQGEKHPNPGKRYAGTYYTTYLPKSQTGLMVLKLLEMAFNAGLLFKIAPTGREEVITWRDGVEHKTDSSGSHGYPDHSYLERVQSQLAALGITPDMLEE